MGPVHREGEDPQNIVNFEDEIEEAVKDSVKEMEEAEEYKAFQELENKLYMPKEIPIHEGVSNSEIMDAITRFSNTFSLFVNEETVKGHAEANKENIALIKLTSIKKDTLCLNAKSLKMQVIHMALWVGVGLCLGLLDHVWLPHIDNMSGAIKEFIKWVIR